MANIAKRAGDWLRNEDSGARSPVERRPSTYLPASYFGPLSNFFWDMDRMFDNSFRNFGIPSLASMPNVQMFNPNIDITSNDNEYTIACEVPGLEEKDIKLDVSADGQLTISGEKRLENTDNRKDTYCTERSYGAFERTLSLPDDVDQENIEARFKNGVLTITCPRAESARQSHRQIPIGSGKASESGRSSYSSGSERTGGQGQKKTA